MVTRLGGGQLRVSLGISSLSGYVLALCAHYNLLSAMDWSVWTQTWHPYVPQSICRTEWFSSCRTDIFRLGHLRSWLRQREQIFHDDEGFFVCFCLFCCCFNLLCNHCSTPNVQPGELLLLSCWAALAELEWHNRVLLWRTHMFSGPSLLASWKVKYHGCIWKIPVGLVCKKLSCLVDLHWSCYMAACAVIQILILSSYSMFAQQNVI